MAQVHIRGLTPNPENRGYGTLLSLRLTEVPRRADFNLRRRVRQNSMNVLWTCFFFITGRGERWAFGADVLAAGALRGDGLHRVAASSDA